ncbi:N2227-like protein-domain-containing protein [Phakopsora pachyrhizi]|nr:N2227-like protein-domain-containing protein [Phakopsora pachyrhizi]
MESGSEELENCAEVIHYGKVIAAFEDYRRYALTTNNRRRKDFYRLPTQDQRLITGYLRKLDEVDDRIRRNADVLDEVVFKARDSGLDPSTRIRTQDSEDPPDEALKMETDSESSKFHLVAAPVQDIDKVRSTLRQFFRDWSKLGETERKACYDPILDRLDRFGEDLASSGLLKRDIRVLVPGSGLGRLVWEVSKRGYTAQGNEFSYQMLLASNMVMNHSECIDQWSIYPFIHSFSNFSNAQDLLMEVKIPDVLASEVLEISNFGVSVGDFVEIFNEPDETENWHAVLTCFFLDTAQNIVQYLRTLYKLLKPNGIWINLGPTLWHFEGSADLNDTSIELDVEELKKLCREVGFVIEDGSVSFFLKKKKKEKTYFYFANWIGGNGLLRS